ncbi:MAG: hypothetical protein V4618_20305 [Pseudomonadota bacterium]
MGDDTRSFTSDPIHGGGGPDREMVSGEEIRRRVQERIDAHPGLRSSDAAVIAPMPKPTASESPTGCNWTMHYLGQFPGCEPMIDDIVELVQHEANIAGPGAVR